MIENLIIREAQAVDTGALKEIFYVTRRISFHWTTPEEFQIDDYLTSVKEEEVWVGIIKSKVIGFISVYVPNNFIHNLFVHPDWQGCGIGIQLLDKGLTRILRPAQLKCEVANTRACRFYEKHGWITLKYST